MQKQEAGSPGLRGLDRYVAWWPVLLGFPLILCFLTWLFPYGVSAYHLEVGGRMLQQAASANDDPDLDILTGAIAHLETAIHWHEDNIQAHRLLGHAYLLQGQLTEAALALVRRTALQPASPLGWWELAQAYEAMSFALGAIPQVDLMDRLVEASPKTYGVYTEPPDGERERQPSARLTTVAEWELPPASGSRPLELEVSRVAARRRVLSTRPPSEVELKMRVPITATVLAFWMGVDPETWGVIEDGVTFRVTIDGQAMFSHSLSAEEARQGWRPGQIDLEAWAGQTVTMTLETFSETASSTQREWAGWGQVQLVPPQAARYLVQDPEAQMSQAWHVIGADTTQFASQGNKAFEEGQYETALAWYRRAGTLNKQLGSSAAFCTAIAAIKSGQKLPRYLDTSALLIHPLTDTVQIEAEILQWVLADSYWNIRYGDRLIDHPSGDPEVGVLWWWGRPAVALVRVQQEGHYQITVRARHSIPDPGQLHIEHNLSSIASFSLSPAWQEFQTTVKLSAGLHIIDVRYIHIQPAEGVDGDAILDWIRLQRVAS